MAKGKYKVAQFYKCDRCSNEVKLIVEGGGNLICCVKAMQQTKRLPHDDPTLTPQLIQSLGGTVAAKEPEPAEPADEELPAWDPSEVAVEEPEPELPPWTPNDDDDDDDLEIDIDIDFDDDDDDEEVAPVLITDDDDDDSEAAPILITDDPPSAATHGGNAKPRKEVDLSTLKLLYFFDEQEFSGDGPINKTLFEVGGHHVSLTCIQYAQSISSQPLDCDQTLFLIEGRGSFSFADREEEIATGASIVIPAGNGFGIKNTSPEDMVVFSVRAE